MGHLPGTRDPAGGLEETVDGVRRRTGLPGILTFRTGESGPPEDGTDPFSLGEADLGFVCVPSLVELGERTPPVVELPVVPVYGESRAAGLSVYFSDVIVAGSSEASGLVDLASARWAYNDPRSLSWYRVLLRRLEQAGGKPRLVRSGSHHRSIEWVRQGRVSAAAIDSNVLWLMGRRDRVSLEGLRIVETWGPHPVQPIVVRPGLEEEVRERVSGALLSLSGDAALEGVGLAGFRRVDERYWSLLEGVGRA